MKKKKVTARKTNTSKRTARKPATRKASAKKAKTFLAGAFPTGAAGTAGIPDVEIDVHDFTNPNWLAEDTAFDPFKAGKIDQMRFHQVALPDPALQADIRLYAAELHDYLTFNGYSTANDNAARAAVRAQIAIKTDPMQSHLDVVANQYKK